MEDYLMGNHICPWWAAYTFDNRLRYFFHNPKKILAQYVTKGMTVLDVGCGMGFFLTLIEKAGLLIQNQLIGQNTAKVYLIR